jgi:hypothetical protein
MPFKWIHRQLNLERPVAIKKLRYSRLTRFRRSWHCGFPSTDEHESLLCDRRIGNKDDCEGDQGKESDARLMKMTAQKATYDKDRAFLRSNWH